MFRVIWYHRNSGNLDIEDFDNPDDAVRFAQAMASTGHDCELSQLGGPPRRPTAAAAGGRIVVPKLAKNGVTAAVAEKRQVCG